MSKKHKAQSGLIEKEDSVLVIIDMQERLFPVMSEKRDTCRPGDKAGQVCKDR